MSYALLTLGVDLLLLSFFHLVLFLIHRHVKKIDPFVPDFMEKDASVQEAEAEEYKRYLSRENAQRERERIFRTYAQGSPRLSSSASTNSPVAGSLPAHLLLADDLDEEEPIPYCGMGSAEFPAWPTWTHWLIFPLLVFGRVPLFFYLVHWLVIGASAAIVHASSSGGLPLAWVPLYWAGLQIVLFACALPYSRFKERTKNDSLWRFL